MNSTGERIKVLRQSANLTQKQMAKKLGVSASTVGMYEHDRRKPDNKMLVKIGKLFAVTVDYLLGLDEQTNEATEIIAKMSCRIRNGQGILLNGIPMSTRDKEKLLYTIEVATNMLIAEKAHELENREGQ